MKVNIIGCGAIGGTILEDMSKAKIDKIYGTDINPKTIDKLKNQGYDVSDKIVDGCDVYVISVLTTDQVISVIEKIKLSDNPLVVIESTVRPGTAAYVQSIRRYIRLVIFPHRYYDKDPTKRVFNLNRVMGAVNDKVLKDALKFYTRYMPRKLIHTTDLKTAEICKPVENWVRYLEISNAEMLRANLEELGYDFAEIRKVSNTKWNINIKEARSGIGGHCLFKDTAMIDNLLPGNFLIKAAMKEDMVYKELVKLWKKKKN